MKHSLTRWLTTWQAAAAALVFIVGTAFAIDTRYVKDGEFQTLAMDVKQGRLTSDRRALRQEETQLQSIPEREKRGLTQFEKDRLKEVQEQLQDVKRDMEEYRPRK